MKKILTAVTVCAVAATMAFGFGACNNTDDSANGDKSPVKLVGVTAQQVGTQPGIDYFVVAEPAATTKVNAIANLDFAGNLQTLYGGENGYPQAVVVAKSSLVESDGAFLSAFTEKLRNANSWLAGGTASAADIVAAVQAHASTGMQTSLNAAALSAQVIQNCSINFVDSKSCKDEIKSFMTKLNAVQNFGTPADAFFCGDLNTSTSQANDIKVVMPDGATAVALAELLATDVDLGKNVNYEVVDSTTIQTYVNGENPKADICVLPVNAAVKVLGSGERYKLLGTLTHGNVYMVSSNGTTITPDNISELCGKTVGVVMLANVPGLTFKVILNQYGIPYTEE